MSAAVIAAGTIVVDGCAVAGGSDSVAGRARLDVAHLDGRRPASSFRSGQIAATICRYAAVAVLVMPRPRVWWRRLVVAAAVLMPLRVALSRRCRGVRHRTGALGGVVLAACWVAALVVVWVDGDIDRTATTTAVAAVIRPAVGVWA